MNDILIGFVITIGCFLVFALMSHLVVESHKKAVDKKKAIDIASIEAASRALREYALREYAKSIREEEIKTVTAKRAGRKFHKIVTLKLAQTLNELDRAIKEEDYERAAELRDEIENLKLELKQFSDEDQTT